MAENWRLSQTFNEKKLEDLVDGDVLSACEFNETGDFLATGDRGGRVCIYEKIDGGKRPAAGSASKVKGASGGPIRTGPPEYQLWTEFQSHEAEFDYLKSLEIEEKINCVRWCKRINNAFFLVTTNDKTIKLWRVQDGKIPEPAVANGYGAGRGLNIPSLRKGGQQDVIRATPKRVFMNGHAYHINSISLNSDQENFLSADDLRINLWNLGCHDTTFNIVDIKPTNMEELTEVITAAVCHPVHCNVFLWSNSKGSVKLADMRSAALCDKHCKVFEEDEDPTKRSFFSEIISSVSDVKFCEDGRYILSRDYMSLKLWDVNMEARPLRTINIHEQLRARLCDLYENDSIFDKFQCAFNGDGSSMVTGSYHNQFHIYHRNFKSDICIEAAKNPQKKAATKKPLLGRAKRDEVSVDQMDFDKKCLHVAWHPKQNCISVAALNSLCIYQGPDTK
mmetsp:Transcript_7554/g.17289  ORF Transcript_7554/g.17289 Transcript_7554/m.17289 type:complete len:449 (+) Transcript_7554:128-1474(+)|eukprot:CAMPEP_0114553440 /NCGR_PEP_ID=MMETSP0114-20121206/7664_1 /TAXON_ID=31324 /ORGANISM="Goniomonas sp, Strain m" /LENGTH=448 /DNA_ID=CAMNT_0001738393 /DNA_START=126 /DNA_END=1472 /DNA_ORIENTATION=+